MKKGLVLGIIALFIVSTVSPMVIGLKLDNVDVERDELLDNLAFYCLDASGGNAKYEFYKEYFQRDNSEIADLEEVTIPVESPQTGVSSGPMDSPWPMKCHDLHHTSRSPYSTANVTGLEKWRFRSEWYGTVESSAVIDMDGTIYFGTMGSDSKVYALFPNGTKKWSYNVGLMIWSTPAIAEDGTIYVTSYDDYLHAVNPNGTLKWKFDAGDSISSSPAIAEDGTIYFGTMLSGNRIYAVNPNGTEKWHYTTGYIITSDPAIGDDGTIYIGSGDKYLYALYPNGTLQWRFRTGDYVKGHPSIADDGTIYFPSTDDYLYALYPNGTLKWKSKTGWGAVSSAAIGEDGTLYIGADKLYAIYPNNGTKKWTLNVGRISHASPAISADGTIYVSAGKSLVAVNPDGTEKWRREICNLRADSSPCIGEDGTIYVGSSWEDENTHRWFGYLHAFGAGGELEADANGPYYGLINQPVQFSGTASYGYPPYSWFWDFGDGNTSDEQNPTNTYINPGNYTVTLTVTDNSSNTSDDTTWAWIQASNDPPDIPEIDGYTSGTAGKSYPYVFETSDIDGNNIWYYIEWDDGTVTGWLGPYNSGERITKSHTWNDRGKYTIRCKAKDVYDEESDWGEFEVTMPMNQQTQNWWFLQFLQNHPRMFPILRQLLGWYVG